MSRDARSALSDSGGMWRLAEATDEQREDEETKRGPERVRLRGSLDRDAPGHDHLHGAPLPSDQHLGAISRSCAT